MPTPVGDWRAKPGNRVRTTHAVVVIVDAFTYPGAWVRYESLELRRWLSVPLAAGIARENTTVLVSSDHDLPAWLHAGLPTARAMKDAIETQFAAAVEAGGTLLLCYAGRALIHDDRPHILASDSTRWGQDEVDLSEPYTIPPAPISPDSLAELLNGVSSKGILVVASVRGVEHPGTYIKPGFRDADTVWWMDEDTTENMWNTTRARSASSAQFGRTGLPIDSGSASEARDALPRKDPGIPQVGSDHFLRESPEEDVGPQEDVEDHLIPAVGHSGYFALFVATTVTDPTVVCGYLRVKSGTVGRTESWAIAPHAYAVGITLWPVRTKDGGLVANTARTLLNATGAIIQDVIRLDVLREAAEVGAHPPSTTWVGFSTTTVAVEGRGSWFVLRSMKGTEVFGRAFTRSLQDGQPDLRPEAWYREDASVDLECGDRLELKRTQMGPSGTAYRGIEP